MTDSVLLSSSVETCSSSSGAKASSGIQGTCRTIPTRYGYCSLHENLLSHESATECFHRLRQEVVWSEMRHNRGIVPRLIALQGEISEEDGSVPLYRHPTDEHMKPVPFSDTVMQIKVLIILVLN